MYWIIKCGIALCILLTWEQLLSIGVPARAATPPDPAFYTLTDLGRATEVRINDAGQVLVYDGSGTGFLNSNGTIIPLPIIPRDLNNLGQVVGIATTGGNNPGGFPITKSFLYSNGAMIDLDSGNNCNVALNGRTCSVAWGINNKSQVVGIRLQNGVSHGFQYDFSAGFPFVVDYGPGITPWDINDFGVTLGQFQNSSGCQSVFIQPESSSQRIDLGNLGNFEKFCGDAYASRINNWGDVVGQAYAGENTLLLRPKLHAFLSSVTDRGTNIRNIYDLNTLGGDNSYAKSINDKGIIVGSSELTGVILDPNEIDRRTGLPFHYFPEHAFVYLDKMTDLNDLLIDRQTGWELGTASDINNSGKIVGLGLSPSDPDNGHAFLLTPLTCCRAKVSGFTYNRKTKTFNGTITITNTSGQFVPAPLQVICWGLNPKVTLVNANGNIPNNLYPYPYVTTPGNGLAPGASVNVPVQFSDPSQTGILFDAGVHVGSPPPF